MVTGLLLAGRASRWAHLPCYPELGASFLAFQALKRGKSPPAKLSPGT